MAAFLSFFLSALILAASSACCFFVLGDESSGGEASHWKSAFLTSTAYSESGLYS